MVPAGEDNDGSVINFINQSVLFIDAPAPKFTQISCERFWFANSSVSIARNVLK